MNGKSEIKKKRHQTQDSELGGNLKRMYTHLLIFYVFSSHINAAYIYSNNIYIAMVCANLLIKNILAPATRTCMFVRSHIHNVCYETSISSIC